MKLSIILVTEDTLVRAYVGAQKQALIPKDSLESGWLGAQHPTVSVSSYTEKQSSPNDLHLFIKRTAKSAEAVMLLVDERLRHLAVGLGSAFFLVFFNARDAHADMKNYFEGILSRAVKNFGSYLSILHNRADQKLLLLPQKNFFAKEIHEITNHFDNYQLSDNFYNALVKILKDLKDRKTPKQYRRYKRTYIVDDKNRFFEYGHEDHSKIETKSPPHSGICELAGNFRFGGRYNPIWHFNVSEAGHDKQISGDFTDCHGQVRGVKPASHINMFPNGFFG